MTVSKFIHDWSLTNVNDKGDEREEDCEHLFKFRV